MLNNDGKTIDLTDAQVVAELQAMSHFLSTRPNMMSALRVAITRRKGTMLADTMSLGKDDQELTAAVKRAMNEISALESAFTALLIMDPNR